MFSTLMDNEGIPFGMNFSGMRTLIKVNDEAISHVFEKIDQVSESHQKIQKNFIQKLTRFQ